MSVNINHFSKRFYSDLRRPGANGFGSISILTFLILFFSAVALDAQDGIPPVKLDDFNKIHAWWDYHKDGSAALDDRAMVNGRGYLLLRLSNPNAEQECNVAISEFQNIYGKAVKRLMVETRVKLLTPMKPGSRGWGFWKSAKGAALQSLCWFMEQMDAGDARLSWKMMGVVAKKQRQTHPWKPEVNVWHVYRIERDLVSNTTRFWIDDSLLLQTAQLAPADRLSFHLWIDNQVYSKKGLVRAAWNGESALLVDYVKIVTQRKIKSTPDVKHPALLLYKAWNDVLVGSGEYVIGDFSFQTTGPTVYVLLTARLESYDGFDEDDALMLYLDDDAAPVKKWSGKDLKGATRSFLLELEVEPGSHRLRLSGKNTPTLYDLLLVDGGKARILFNKALQPLSPDSMEIIIRKEPDEALLGYAAATLDESPEFNHILPVGRLEESDQDLQIRMLDQQSNLLKAFFFCGNESLGECRTKLWTIRGETPEILVKLRQQGSPELHRLIFFQSY